MAVDDLAGIPGLQDKHRKTLSEVLQVTTARGMVLTERQLILSAMRQRRVNPRPTLEEIADWQDHARRRLREPTASPSEWDRAATFVVSFEHRLLSGDQERRLAVEQAELEPEQPPAVWPSWDCQPLCAWMLEQIGLFATTAPMLQVLREVSDSDSTSGSDGAPHRPPSARGDRPRPQTRIVRIEFVDRDGRLDVIADDIASAASQVVCTVPGHLNVVVTGAEPARDVHVGLRLRPPGARGWNQRDPVVVRGSDPVEFDLSEVAQGEYEATVLAWTPDGSANPAVLMIRGLTIQS